MRILGVFRDVVPARMAALIQKEAQKEGIAFTTVAEGRAVPVFKEAGVQLFLEGGDLLSPFGSADIDMVLRQLRPDILCVGASYPINWERDFALAAKKAGIPVVVIADIWGAVSRLGDMKPDYAFVIDEWEAERLRAQNIDCCVIGDIASLAKTEAPQELSALEHFKSLQHTFTTVLLVGDDIGVLSELASLTAECLRKGKYPESFVIIPRWVHPKRMGDPEVERLVAQAQGELEGLTVDLCLGWSTDALAARCEYTVCSYSTTLRIALHNGRRALSLHGPLCRALLKEETGFETFPLVENGVVAPITIPLSFSVFDWKYLEGKARLWAQNAHFRPEAAIEKFISIAQGR